MFVLTVMDACSAPGHTHRCKHTPCQIGEKSSRVDITPPQVQTLGVVIKKALLSIISFWLYTKAYRVTVNDPYTVQSVTLTAAEWEQAQAAT